MMKYQLEFANQQDFNMKKIFNKRLNQAKNEQGFMFVAIILIVVVIFSITLVSGAEEFTFSPDDPGDTSPTANPSVTISPSVPVTPTTSITPIITLTPTLSPTLSPTP